MRIDRLTASFGKLENRTLRLHDGLNVIYAPNESGKSTWCAFILAMLFGIDSSERSRAGYLPDKQRYAPWSGAPMEGVMDLTDGRRNITLTRSTKSKNAPMREFSAVYTGTSTPVEGMNAGNVGELLTGVSKSVFRRSAFIGQGAIAVNGSPDLERRISAIVSTGEEQSSYSELEEQLRGWLRRRRFNRKGLLPELETRMSETERRLEDMSGATEELEQLSARHEALRIRSEALESKVNECRSHQRKAALERLSSSRSELKRRSQEHDEAMAELSVKRAKVREHPLGDLSYDEASKQVRDDMKRIDQLGKSSSVRRPVLPALLLLALAAVAAAMQSRTSNVVFLILAILLSGAAVFFLMKAFAANRSAASSAEEMGALLKKYKVSSVEEINAIFEEYGSLCKAAEAASEKEKYMRQLYEAARSKQEQLEHSAIEELDFATGDSEAARLGRELASARAEMSRISDRISHLNGRFAAMGDPLVLNSDLGVMKETRDAVQREYDAIDLALEVLRDADEELQSRFAPNLGKLAGKYMSMLTGGRYTKVLLNRDLTAMAQTTEDTVPHESTYLSAGTMDLMYLAVRLAVCELALPGGEPCPLIIDDALVNLDDQRLQRAMNLLWDLSRDRQIILFTCRDTISSEFK